jgi:hypothetical protein
MYQCLNQKHGSESFTCTNTLVTNKAKWFVWIFFSHKHIIKYKSTFIIRNNGMKLLGKKILISSIKRQHYWKMRIVVDPQGTTMYSRVILYNSNLVRLVIYCGGDPTFPGRNLDMFVSFVFVNSGTCDKFYVCLVHFTCIVIIKIK